MDLRVLVLTADPALGELVRAQVENLGCRCTLAASYHDADAALAWADAAIVDLAADGLDDLNRLRVEAPTMRLLAITPDEDRAEAARSAGVERVLAEPFAIADLVQAVRAMGRPAGPGTVDLREGATATEPTDDRPWWVTR